MKAALRQLKKCNEIIAKDNTVGDPGNLSWLDDFCAQFLHFAKEFQSNLSDWNFVDGNINIETSFLCLSQVITCITHLEVTIKTESKHDVYLPVAREHFLDRINWCLRRLHVSLHAMNEQVSLDAEIPLEERTFVELLDLVLGELLFYVEDTTIEQTTPMPIIDLESSVNQILRHALAFASIALDQDKRALRSLCENLLGEWTTFQQSLELSFGDRKLAAMSLERSLYCLEKYLNESLLRLVFTSLLNVDEISIEKLKSASNEHLEELIADFDINMDRIQQIGVFAIAFSPQIKTRTTVRSCLASLESLDAYIVPLLQAQKLMSHHSEILERHFNEEIKIFRNLIQEIIDSQALISNYLDMLTQSIELAAKRFNHDELLQVIKMGNVLIEHFRNDMNSQHLHANEDNLQIYQKFLLILRECSAILMLNTQVAPVRIMKRLKILQSVLSKLRDVFLDGLKGTTQNTNNTKNGGTIQLVVPQGGHQSMSIYNISRFQKTNNTVSKIGKRQRSRSSLFRIQEVASSNSITSDLISFQFTDILSIK